MIARPELIIFDCDGVLVDSEPMANAVLAAWLTKQGLAMTGQEASQRFKGLSMATVLERAEAALGKPLPSDFLDQVQAETYARFRTDLKPVAGASELVEWAQAQGFKTCIASSGDFEKMDVTLGVTALKPLFEDRIFSSKQVPRGKPAPDLFLFAAAQMGVLAERAVVIEDSPAGVAAARAAGMPVFAYGDFEAEPGVYPVSHIGQIAKLL